MSAMGTPGETTAMRWTFAGCWACVRPIVATSNTPAMNSRRRIRSPRRRGLSQILTNFRQELARADGLSDIGIATRRASLVVIPAQGMSGDRDDGNGMQHRVGLQAPSGLVAVENGQLNVHEDEVRPVRFRRGKSCLAVHGFDHFEIGAREQIAQDFPIVFLILDHQDALAHDFPACASTRTGRVKWNIDPLPGSDSAQIRPPCISMMRLAIDSPRPVPPFLRVIELSACWNSSKIFAWSTAGMPGPVSHTATVNAPFVADARIATSPLSVNLMALPTRLSRTWESRLSSPRPAGRSGATSAVKASRFSAASGSTADTTPCTRSLSE